MTNFEAVSKFNELIGNAKGAANVSQIRKQYDLIKSEFEELDQAICFLENSSETDEYGQECGPVDEALTEIRDAIADVLVTTYGLAHRMGIDADADMRAVEVSNNSKFYTGTESSALEVAKALGDSLSIQVEARQRGEALDHLYNPVRKGRESIYVWAFVSADDSDPERPRGKLLKAPSYKPPVFD